MTTRTEPATTVHLEHRFADRLPELALPWQAEEAPDPRLLVLDEGLAGELGLDPSYLRGEEGVRLLVGTHVPPGARPVAQAYAGHQFGGFNPRLGDGRALLLGELVDRGGRVRDLHLKGSGRTPFARGGDGLAAVGPMLREHVLSRAMHALGVPTTRSLAVTATGRDVRRETPLPGAVLARVASSHLRVGSFQYARGLDDPDVLVRLADLAIERHHPQAAEAEHPHRALLEAVVTAQARLVAQWMLLGFVHGVLNTDNVTISGETIDYGPCAFLDAFDPGAVFSSIDEGGRYAFGNQPAIAEWNLARLAEAMLPLLARSDDQAGQDAAIELAVESLGIFRTTYADAWAGGLAAKLSLPVSPELTPLVDDLVVLLRDGPVDWTSFWRALSAGTARDLFLDVAGFDAWTGRWRTLAGPSGPDTAAMDRVNPVYIPRNHLVEEALAAGTAGDLGPLHALTEALDAPYDERPGLERYAEPAPESFGGYVTYCGT